MSVNQRFDFHKRFPPIYRMAFFLAIAIFLLYLPSLDGDFLNWDDGEYIYKNVHMSNLSPEFIKYAFTHVINSNYHPLTIISYGLDYTFWGLNPKGYHLTNVLLHSLNTALVVLLSFALIDTARAKGFTVPMSDRTSLFVAAGTGLLFGTHPLHVESVAWVSERKDVLYAAFYLSGMMTYLKYTPSARQYYWITAIFFLLSILSKPMAVTFPAILLLLDYYPLKRFSNEPGGVRLSKLLLEKLAFFALGFAFSIITILSQTKALIAINELYWYERPLLAIRGLVFYLYKFILPIGLAPFYRADTSPAGLADIAAILLVAGITFYCATTFWKKRLWTALWAYYIIALLPVLNLVQAGSQGAADRYTYMPLLAPMFLSALMAAIGFKRAGGSRFFPDLKRAILMFVYVGVISVIIYSTYNQIGFWKNSMTLWTREIKVFPYEPLALSQLSDVYLKQKKYRKAEFYITTALQINPKDPMYYLKRSHVFSGKGQYLLALRDLDSALRLNPRYEEALQYRSYVLNKLKGRKRKQSQ